MNNPNDPQALTLENDQSRRQMANYKFNAEEIRVLKECNRASFFERSLPISGMLGAAAYYAVKQGYLKAGRYGPTPKVCTALMIGYFIGKVSYQGKCAQMLMQLPDSPLGDMLRQRQKGSFYSQVKPDPTWQVPFASTTDIYTDDGMRRGGSSLDLDTSRPSNPGLDDVYRPSLDSSPPTFNYDEVQLPLEPPKQEVTYDELRKRNREEYSQQRQLSQMLPPGSRPPVVRPVDPSEPVKRNKYGDTWSGSE